MSRAVAAPARGDDEFHYTILVTPGETRRSNEHVRTDAYIHIRIYSYSIHTYYIYIYIYVTRANSYVIGMLLCLGSLSRFREADCRRCSAFCNALFLSFSLSLSSRVHVYIRIYIESCRLGTSTCGAVLRIMFMIFSAALISLLS